MFCCWWWISCRCAVLPLASLRSWPITSCCKTFQTSSCCLWTSCSVQVVTSRCYKMLSPCATSTALSCVLHHTARVSACICNVKTFSSPNCCYLPDAPRVSGSKPRAMDAPLLSLLPQSGIYARLFLGSCVASPFCTLHVLGSKRQCASQ